MYIDDQKFHLEKRQNENESQSDPLHNDPMTMNGWKGVGVSLTSNSQLSTRGYLIEQGDATDFAQIVTIDFTNII